MLLIWNIFDQICPIDYLARGSALVTYVIIAEFLIHVGHQKQLAQLRMGGIAIIVFVTLRLLLIEVSKMPMIARVATFLVVGLLLIGTTFFDKKYKDKEVKRANT